MFTECKCNVNVNLLYSLLPCGAHAQLTLQLHPWQACSSFRHSQLPAEYSALTRINCQAHQSTMPSLPIAKYPFTPGWSEAVVTGGFAQFLQCHDRVRTRDLRIHAPMPHKHECRPLVGCPIEGRVSDSRHVL